MSETLFSPETSRKILEHLNKRWKHPRNCPICQSADWHVQPGELIQPIQESQTPNGPTFYPGSGTIPTIQAMCTICFYVHTFLLIPIINGEEDSNG